MQVNKYNNGKIYKIVDLGYNNCYIGSTVEALSRRMCHRRCNYNRKIKHPCNSSLVFEKYGIQNCKIELIENYPCNSKEELTAREGYHIKQNNCVNKFIAGRSKKDWYKDNAEYVSNKAKEYREENKEHIKEIKHNYYANNKEYFNKKNREHYQHKKEQVLDKNKEQIVCECGCSISRRNIASHKQSPKHVRLMKNLEHNI